MQKNELGQNGELNQSNALDQNNALDLAQQRKGRMVLMLMVIFFIVPVIVVLLMVKFDWKPNIENFGELVKPPRELTSANLNEAQKNTLPPLLWKEKWSIVYVSAECAEVCMAKLRDMRQLHASLYKDIVRVQRVFITRKTDVSAIKKDFPDLIIIHQPQETINSLVPQFQHNAENVETANRFYLVDPLGFYMMTYAADTPLANVRKDIVKLLKFAWAG